MPVKALMMVQNNMPGPSVFHIEGSSVSLQLEGRDHPSGQDVKRVSIELLESPEFMEAIDKGVFTIINPSPEVQELLAEGEQYRSALAAHFADQQAARAATATATLDRKADNDILGVSCVGPKANGTGECGVLVPIPVQQVDSKAPLCNQHEHLRPQFTIFETDQINPDTGRAKKVWRRAVTV